jgi:hypothetical protein
LRVITVKVDQFEQSSNKNKRDREDNKTENTDAAGTKAETAGTKEAAQ